MMIAAIGDGLGTEIYDGICRSVWCRRRRRPRSSSSLFSLGSLSTALVTMACVQANAARRCLSDSNDSARPRRALQMVALVLGVGFFSSLVLSLSLSVGLLWLCSPQLLYTSMVSSAVPSLRRQGGPLCRSQAKRGDRCVYVGPLPLSLCPTHALYTCCVFRMVRRDVFLNSGV